MRTLERAHPLCCFLYILAVLAVTIFTRHPLLLGCSAAGAALLLVLSGKWRTVLWMPLVVLVCAVTNPIFSHNGDTVLFFVSHLPVTLESVAYGAVFGLMLAASVGWSVAAVRFITSDKYIWLFG
ncbi:MAG: energy-coupling factor transporter transmembrane protein EcfT, partial [Ruminococcaceae bacterium]|nr:energy-coupling factor transporter transmembrane protein EcfT [Oscillospiraceae bacterium]